MIVGRCTDAGCKACGRFAPVLVLLTPARSRPQDIVRLRIPRSFCARHRARVGYDVGKLGIGEATWAKIVGGVGWRVTRERILVEWAELN